MRGITRSATASVAQAKSSCMTPISMASSRRTAYEQVRGQRRSSFAPGPPPLRQRTAAQSRSTPRPPRQRPFSRRPTPAPGVTASRAVCLRPDLARWRGEEESTTMGGKRLATTALALLVALVGRAPGVGAAIPRGAGPTPPRLSFTDGEVSFWRPGAADWAPAQINTALVPGDETYTGNRGNLELQVGARAFVRAWGDTQLGLVNEEPDFLQLKVTAGHVY